MNKLRKTLTHKEPLHKFQLECNECGDELVVTGDYVRGRAPYNEAIMLYKIDEHHEITGHTDFYMSALGNPIEQIDATVTVGDSRQV